MFFWFIECLLFVRFGYLFLMSFIHVWLEKLLCQAFLTSSNLMEFFHVKSCIIIWANIKYVKGSWFTGLLFPYGEFLWFFNSVIGFVVLIDLIYNLAPSIISESSFSASILICCRLTLCFFCLLTDYYVNTNKN